jgi:hypothetical protein
MGRFDNYDDYEYEDWQPALWEGRVSKVMGGRPALQSFRELEQALLWLPRPALIEGTVCDGENVCAVGAFALHKRVMAGEPTQDVLDSLKYSYGEDDPVDTAHLGQKHGMTYTLAWLIGEENDGYHIKKMTPEERYTAVLEWTRKHIARLEAKHGARA